MSTYLYKGIYITLIGVLFVATILTVFSGNTTQGTSQFAAYAQSGEGMAPGLILAVRDVRVEEGQNVVMSSDGVYGTVGVVQNTIRSKGGLVYDTGEAQFTAQEAGYRAVATLPLLGVVAVGVNTLWGQLVLFGIPLIMLLTHASLAVLVRVMQSERAARRAEAEEYYGEEYQEEVQNSAVAAPMVVRETVSAYDEERDGVTELDTIVRPRTTTEGYRVVISGKHARLGM